MAAGDASTAGSAGPPVRRKPPRWRPFLVSGFRLLILLLLGFLAMIYLLQDRMIFPGSATQKSAEASFFPRSGAELLQLTSARGERVTALYGPALLADGRPHPEALSRPALVYFYGNAMCLAYAETEFDRFRRLGLNVLIPDYLGYGLGTARPLRSAAVRRPRRPTRRLSLVAFLPRGSLPAAGRWEEPSLSTWPRAGRSAG